MSNKERNAKILEMHDKGYSLTAIAEEVGLSTTQTRNILQLEVGKRAHANQTL